MKPPRDDSHLLALMREDDATAVVALCVVVWAVIGVAVAATAVWLYLTR